jgi:NAD(P)-dependent dehydrogenase (short-subunit alcohol dehydrogenase family)
MVQHNVALVTGASRGIGRGIALAVAAVGYDVVVNYMNNREAAQLVAKQIAAFGSQALLCKADISKATHRIKLVECALKRFGHIDVLVNNAGIAPLKRDDILHASEESFDRVINTNLKGPYFLTQRVACTMIQYLKTNPDAKPMIINISSISSYTSSPFRGDYCVSKAGLSMMTKLYADRLAEYGIQVFEICPGIIETDMTAEVKEKYEKIIGGGRTPIRRMGQAEDVGKAVVAIVSGAFPFSTGEVINVDGGFHLQRL